jgi:hypothetical protein
MFNLRMSNIEHAPSGDVWLDVDQLSLEKPFSVGSQVKLTVRAMGLAADYFLLLTIASAIFDVPVSMTRPPI